MDVLKQLFSTTVPGSSAPLTNTNTLTDSALGDAIPSSETENNISVHGDISASPNPLGTPETFNTVLNRFGNAASTEQPSNNGVEDAPKNDISSSLSGALQSPMEHIINGEKKIVSILPFTNKDTENTPNAPNNSGSGLSNLMPDA